MVIPKMALNMLTCMQTRILYILARFDIYAPNPELEYVQAPKPELEYVQAPKPELEYVQTPKSELVYVQAPKPELVYVQAPKPELRHGLIQGYNIFYASLDSTDIQEPYTFNKTQKHN